MNLWKKQKLMTGLILLVTIVLLVGCSPASSPETSNNPSLDLPLSEINPAGDSADIAEGLSQAEASNSSDFAGQAQPSETDFVNPETLPADTSGAAGEPEPPVREGALLESPSLKAAPDSASQPETAPETAPEAAPQSGLESVPAPAAEAGSAEAAAAPAGEANIGFQAPDFSLSTVDGQSLSLSELRGKNVLLNYWVTWCIPCLEEMPVLEKLHREYQDQNLVILSVNGINQDELDKVAATMGENSVTFPVVLDQSAAVYDLYRVQFMPTSFFIDDQGVIRYIQLGSSTEDVLRTKIEELIADQL
jgi:peroxiredoxin